MHISNVLPAAAGMSEKFNPLEESCQAACVRAVSEELKSAVTHTGAEQTLSRPVFHAFILTVSTHRDHN